MEICINNLFTHLRTFDQWGHLLIRVARGRTCFDPRWECHWNGDLIKDISACFWRPFKDPTYCSTTVTLIGLLTQAIKMISTPNVLTPSTH